MKKSTNILSKIVDCFEFGFPYVEIEIFSLDIGAKSKILWILWDEKLHWEPWSRSALTLTSSLFNGFSKTISAVCNNIEAKFVEQFVEVSSVSFLLSESLISLFDFPCLLLFSQTAFTIGPDFLFRTVKTHVR